MKKVNGMNPNHREHELMLDSLKDCLKDEVNRGLKLLDTCATQIAQARWIFVNVNKTISESYSDCPVCENQQKAGASKSKAKDSPPTAKPVPKKESPKSLFPLPARKPKVEQVNAALKKETHPLLEETKTALPKPVHRPGPRSKTRPDHPVAVPVKSSTLPKTKTIIVRQTGIKIFLNDIKPYLKGAAAVSVDKLGGYDSNIPKKIDNLYFEPSVIKTTSGKVSKYTTAKSSAPRYIPKKRSRSPVGVRHVGLASKKFMENLAKEKHSSSAKKYISPAIIDSDSSESSDDDKPLISLASKSKPPHSEPKEAVKRSEDRHKENPAAPTIRTKPGPASSKNKNIEARPASSSHTKPASTRMTITLPIKGDNMDMDCVFDKIKEKTKSSGKDADPVKAELVSSSHDKGSDAGKPIAVNSRPGPASKKVKVDSTPEVHVEASQNIEPSVVPVKLKPGPASKKKPLELPKPAPSSIKSEVSHRSGDGDSVHSGSVHGTQPEDEPGGMKRKLSQESVTSESSTKKNPAQSAAAALAKKFNPALLNSAMKASLVAKLQLLSKKKPTGMGSKPESSTGSPVKPAPKPNEQKQGDEEDNDNGMELGAEIIGKCIDELEDGSPTKKPESVKLNRPPSFSLSTDPPPTLQDCISPDGVKKFFKGPKHSGSGSDCTDVLEQPDGGKEGKISRAQELLKRLSHSEFEKVAALHSQDKISELFGGLSTKKVKTERRDIKLDTWYLVEDEILGQGTSSDSVAAVQWGKVEEGKLDTILEDLETYTLACIR